MNNIISLNDHIITHCHESMERALSAERFPSWQRSCPEMNDIDFTRFGLLRCISAVDSGRHFLQTTEEVHGELLPHSTYFKSLKSSRRTRMLEALERQSYEIHRENMASQGIDYLKLFPELAEYTIEAADGHFIDHSSHLIRFIYAMNLRNGLLRPLCCITNGTKRHHEIPVLRNHIEHQNSQRSQLDKNLYVYDKAVIDFRWWEKQKGHKNYMISVLKENSVATWIESIPFDNSNPINTGVEDYSIYENQGIRFNVVHYRDPETQKLHRFLCDDFTGINESGHNRTTVLQALDDRKSLQ